MSDKKECFVISPIGEEGSETRERADKLLEHIIREALEDYEFEVIRADEMSEPGSITSQVIEKVVECDLVIADLTSHNPNVFYELAIRHATGEPYIQLIQSNQTIPFDISDVRTIKYSFDVEVATQTVENIQEQIKLMEGDDPNFDSPISRSANLKSWRESENPEDRGFAEIVDFMDRLASRMDSLEKKMDQSVREKQSKDSKKTIVTTSKEDNIEKINIDDMSKNPFIERATEDTDD